MTATYALDPEAAGPALAGVPAQAVRLSIQAAPAVPGTGGALPTFAS